MNIPSLAKIGRREMYDDILTIVIRFIGGGFTTALLRSRDGQRRDFFSKFFPLRFRRGKNRNTSNRFFIESKWKLPKNQKQKSAVVNPP